MGREKIGNLSFVCHEYNFTKVSDKTWWIDSSLQFTVPKLCRAF